MATKSAEHFELITFKQTQTRLNSDATKTLLYRLVEQGKISQEEMEGCFKDIEMSMVKTTRKDPSQKAKFKAPDLSNATVEGLVDMLGQTREEMANKKKEEGYIKERLMAELVALGEAAPSPAPEWKGWGYDND